MNRTTNTVAVTAGVMLATFLAARPELPRWGQFALIIVCMVAAAIYVRRHEHLMASWRKVSRRIGSR